MSGVGDLVPLLDPRARAGRTRHRLLVNDARNLRAKARRLLGTSGDDTPSVRELVAAAVAISSMLDDATKGEARLAVHFTPKATGDGTSEYHPTYLVASTLDAGN